MKKLFSLLLAIMMIATIALPVFAEESVDANGGSANVNVNGVVQYTGSSETQTISVDVAWEDMTFTYVEGVHFGWNPENHEYAGAYEGYWENDRADITVTNHSNTEVNATLSFESGVDTVSGAFTEGSGTMDDGVLELASAVDTEVEEAPTATATFNIIKSRNSKQSQLCPPCKGQNTTAVLKQNHTFLSGIFRKLNMFSTGSNALAVFA